MKADNHSFYIISTHDFSRKSAGSTRMHYYAKALAAKGDSVFLVSSCSTTFDETNFTEISPNVFVLNEKKITIGLFSTFKFLKRFNSFVKKKNESNTVLLYPTVFLALELLTLIYLKWYKKYNLFYELNEVRKHSSSHEANMSFKRIFYSLEKLVFKIIFNVTQPLLHFYDGLICISTNIEAYGRRFNKNTILIPILTDSNDTVEITEGNYSQKGNFNIGFSGSIDPIKEDMGNFIEIIEKLNQNGYSISFNLCGPVSKKFETYFLDKCNRGKLINYYGFLNEIELSTFLSQQDLLAIPRGYTKQNNYGFSTKLSDYLNHDKMVLVTDISDNKLYIKDNENGFIVPPNDKTAMYDKIKYIVEESDVIREDIVSRAQDTSKLHFDYWLHAEKLRSFLKGYEPHNSNEKTNHQQYQ